jgi:protein-tyrosine phosphatase
MIAQADIVLTATRAHRGKVAMLHPKALRYVFAFREFADLLEGVPADDLRADGRTAAEHVAAVVALAASQRGARPPLSDREADIVDPYRQDASVFAAMNEQILSSLPTIATALGRS